jgi:hypothetical protein
MLQKRFRLDVLISLIELLKLYSKRQIWIVFYEIDKIGFPRTIIFHCLVSTTLLPEDKILDLLWRCPILTKT